VRCAKRSVRRAAGDGAPALARRGAQRPAGGLCGPVPRGAASPGRRPAVRDLPPGRRGRRPRAPGRPPGRLLHLPLGAARCCGASSGGVAAPDGPTLGWGGGAYRRGEQADRRADRGRPDPRGAGGPPRRRRRRAGPLPGGLGGGRRGARGGRAAAAGRRRCPAGACAVRRDAAVRDGRGLPRRRPRLPAGAAGRRPAERTPPGPLHHRPPHRRLQPPVLLRADRPDHRPGRAAGLPRHLAAL